MNLRKLFVPAACLLGLIPGRAYAEGKSYPLGPDPMEAAFVTEATLGQEWNSLDHEVDDLQLEQPTPLRKIDDAALHVNDGWKEGTTAPPPVEGDNGRVVLVYGAVRPTIVCAPLRVCMIQLKPGETVTDLQAGDAVRWKVELSTSGLTTYVVVKPRSASIETDLAVITDQRAYVFNLRAHPTQHMSIVSFEYPDDQRASWRSAILKQAKHRQETPPVAGPTADDQLISVNPRNLNSRYEIEIDNPWFCRRKHNCVDWAPHQVLDDGKRTWIRLPPSVDAGTLPVLFIKTTAGWEQVAFRYKRETFTFYVDRVFNVAELVLGVGGKEGKVTLIRKGKS